MRHQLIFIALFISIMIKVFSQETAPENLLNTHSSWEKEYFEFPLSFAQDIPYQGHEEAYFPKPFKDAIWNSLNAITLNHKSCEIKSN